VYVTGDSTEPNWYDVLGVPTDASGDQIRRAYFHLVRRFPPRRFPGDFQRITRAYHTLGDVRRRSEYDQGRVSGRRVTVLVDQAAIAAEKDPQKAMMLLKSAVTLAPDMPRPRALLAHVLMRIQEFEIAERQYRWLIRYAPGDEAMRLRLARCLFAQGRLGDAEAELQDILRLNPGYHDALTLLSEIYATSQQYEQQAATLERAIQNDGRVNWADFEALLQLLVLRLRQGDAEAIEAASARLRSIVSPDKAATAVRRFLELAESFRKSGSLSLAVSLTEHARRITLCEESAELAQSLPQQQARMTRILEARSLVCDTLVGAGLTLLAQVLYLDESKDALRQSRMQAALERVKQEIEAEPRELIRRLEYMRKEYPAIGAEQEAVFSQLRRRAEVRLEQLAQEAVAAPSSFEPPAPEPAVRRGFFDRLLGNSSG
jgi:tetratricopeptide (TPR) repeat protein